jgi:tetratricopeptide (TPR) repeat protein
MLDALTPGIQDQTLSPQDRFGIQTDVYALAHSGHINYVDYLKLLRQAYKHEDNLTVWKSILRQLTDLNSIFDYANMNNTKKLFRTYICHLLSNIYGKLEWERLPNEGSQAAMLRGLVLIQMGINGHNKTHDEAQKLFEKILNDDHQHAINPNTRAAIYLTVAKTGNQQTFEQLKSVIYLYEKRL